MVRPKTREQGAVRQEGLDGLRGVAVLIVFLSHTAGRDIKIAPWLDLQGTGHVGVYLFFVLSGFLLTRNLLAGQRVETFLIRRFFRIAPLYYIVLIGTFLVQHFTGTVDTQTIYVNDGGKGLILSMLFLQGDGVFWSVAAEFAFYALLPLILLGIERFGWVWVAIAAAVSFCWLVAIEIFRVPLPPLRFVDILHATQYFDVFIAGVAAAFITRELPHRAIALTFVATLLATLICVSDKFLVFNQPWFGLRWLSLPYGVVFALTVASVAQGSSVLSPILNTRLLRFVGNVGFSWYLLHLALFPLVKATGIQSGVLLFVCAFVVMAAASWTTFTIIERPFMRLGRRLERAAPAALSTPRPV